MKIYIFRDSERGVGEERQARSIKLQKGSVVFQNFEIMFFFTELYIDKGYFCIKDDI